MAGDAPAAWVGLAVASPAPSTPKLSTMANAAPRPTDLLIIALSLGTPSDRERRGDMANPIAAAPQEGIAV
jgi:hypothetical protein